MIRGHIEMVSTQYRDEYSATTTTTTTIRKEYTGRKTPQWRITAEAQAGGQTSVLAQQPSARWI